MVKIFKSIALSKLNYLYSILAISYQVLSKVKTITDTIFMSYVMSRSTAKTVIGRSTGHVVYLCQCKCMCMLC